MEDYNAICTKAICMMMSIVVVIVGCQDSTLPMSSLNPDDAALKGESFDFALNRAIHQTSDVYAIPITDLTLVEGANASLIRNKNGVRLNIQTRELEPGFAYTVWMVVFDAPENCIIPNECGVDDLTADPNPAEATVFGATGGSIAGGIGKDTFATRVAPGDEFKDIRRGDGSLDNPLTAEIHFVLRSHGPTIPGMIQDQISTFNGVCNPGEPNEGQCEDVQFGIFR